MTIKQRVLKVLEDLCGAIEIEETLNWLHRLYKVAMGIRQAGEEALMSRREAHERLRHAAGIWF